MALYQYEAIPHLETARVMSLAPGQPSDPLSGTLSTMSVVDPDPYEALSYAWGYKAPMDSTILCSGKALRITSSLAVALKRLRYTNRPRVIWVDQICINQKDLAERSRQVQHMNFIYQKASEVIVWLGDDDHGHAERAFSLVKSLVAVAEDPDRLELFKQRQLEGNLEWFAREDWIALAELLKTPWVCSTSQIQGLPHHLLISAGVPVALLVRSKVGSSRDRDGCPVRAALGTIVG